jgi:hypothetical protein
MYRFFKRHCESDRRDFLRGVLLLDALLLSRYDTFVVGLYIFVGVRI